VLVCEETCPEDRIVKIRKDMIKSERMKKRWR
jgi:hypothetical protein